MPETTLPTPDRLVLATDLSARCDRALDRSAQLAAEWSAELLALHVLDLAAMPDQALAWAGGADDATLLQAATEQLRRDLAGLSGVRTRMHTVRGGDVATRLRETAADSGAGLVVTGVARDEALGRFLLGSSVERLAHSLPQPLLVVRQRARGPYQRIVVATDFSAPSRQALQLALRWWPGRPVTLFHALGQPLAGLPGEAELAQARQRVQAGVCAEFLAGCSLPAGAEVRPVIEGGAVAAALSRHVRQHGTDLVVLATHGSGGLMDRLLGSTAGQLLDWLPCDALVVRATRNE